MALSLSSPWLSRLSHPSLPFPNNQYGHNHSLLFKSLTLNLSRTLRTKAYSLSESESESSNGVAENNPVSELLDVEFLNQVSSAKDAYEVLQMIEERSERNGGVVSVSDCSMIISAALERNNPDLALSVFYAMRSSFDQGICLAFYQV